MSKFLMLLAAFDVKWLIPIGLFIGAGYSYYRSRTKSSYALVFAIVLLLGAIAVTVGMILEK